MPLGLEKSSTCCIAAELVDTIVRRASDSALIVRAAEEKCPTPPLPVSSRLGAASRFPDDLGRSIAEGEAQIDEMVWQPHETAGVHPVLQKLCMRVLEDLVIEGDAHWALLRHARKAAKLAKAPAACYHPPAAAPATNCTEPSSAITALEDTMTELCAAGLCTGTCLMYAVGLLLRLQRVAPRAVSSPTIRRYFVASIMVTGKVHEDAYYTFPTLSDAIYSKPITCDDLQEAERQFLSAIQFSVHLSEEEYYSTKLLVVRKLLLHQSPAATLFIHFLEKRDEEEDI